MPVVAGAPSLVEWGYFYKGTAHGAEVILSLISGLPDGADAYRLTKSLFFTRGRCQPCLCTCGTRLNIPVHCQLRYEFDEASPCGDGAYPAMAERQLNLSGRQTRK